MKIIRLVIFSVVLFGSASTASAQMYRRATRIANYVLHADSVVNNFKKSLSKFEFDFDDDSSYVAFNPYMYRLSDPSTYYSQSLRNEFNIDWKSQYNDNQPVSSKGMAYRTSLNQMIDRALVGAYMNNTENFHHYDSQFDNVELLSEERKETSKEELDAILKSAPVIDDVTKVIDTEAIDITPEKPNFWKKAGKFTTQFTQSYFSENWYKGGSNNVTLLSTLLLEANYNDQKKIQWDNKADFRLGFVSTPSDEFHKFITNNDKIYLASKLGIKATKAWFYTIQGDVNSQFLPGYRTNKKETFSKFLSPLDVFVSIGMDFKPTLKKGSFSAALLPLSYKMRYINGDDENNTIHSTYSMMKDGEPITTKHDFGSKVELNAKFEIVKNLTWRSRAYYYTTYKYAEAEWENALSFQFNKYLSTEVNALWRFDDNRSPSTKEGHNLGYFQFKEYFTFGLAYNF